MCCNHMIENADERLALQTSSSGASGVGVVFFDFLAGFYRQALEGLPIGFLARVLAQCHPLQRSSGSEVSPCTS